MGAAISLVGLVGLVVGALSISTSSPWLPRLKAAEAKIVIGGAMAALLVGGLLLMPAPTGSREEPARSEQPTRSTERTRSEVSSSGDLVETLRAYLRSNAPTEAAAIAEYLPNRDGSGLVVRTTLFASPENLAAGQRICEIARNVILPVRVEAADGSELWRCDQIESEGSPQLVAAALPSPSVEPSPLSGDEDFSSDIATGPAPRSRRPATRSAPAAPAAAQAAAATGCHPSYVGECLPASVDDVDCLGGGGNGPHYAQSNNIEIVGSDVFGLDADGDGYGCDAEDALVERVLTNEVQDDPDPSPEICHPSYAGECLPVDVNDVDCAGGGGDGPHYARSNNIQVVGPDVFGLDADNDGLGCDA